MFVTGISSVVRASRRAVSGSSGYTHNVRLASTGRGGVGSGVSYKGRKRFYKETSVGASQGQNGQAMYRVLLDGKALKTPQRNVMEVPSRELAMAVALEWDSQDGARGIQPTTMPLMTLAASAIDNESSRDQTIATIMGFFDSDTICYFAHEYEEDIDLVRRQKKNWDPVRKWLKEELNIDMGTSVGVKTVEHAEDARESAQSLIEQLDKWRLTVLHAVVKETKSVGLGLALLYRKLTIEQINSAARVDEEFQVERWGVVEGGHDLDRAHSRVALASSSTFLHLLPSL